MIKHIKKILIISLCISVFMTMAIAKSAFASDVIGGGSLVPAPETKDEEGEIVGPGSGFPGLPMEFSTVGDLDGNGWVDSDDAIYLLMGTMFPGDYKFNQNVDFDKSGKIDSDDAIYLLMHTLFDNDYPIGNVSDFSDE